MRNPIRQADAPLLVTLIPLFYAIPSQIVSNGKAYQGLVNSVPDWFFWISVGFAGAAWLLDPFRKQSRLRDLWSWLFDKFEVAHLHAGTLWSQWGDDGSNMPDSDIGVRLRIRWIKNARNLRLRLRVYSCTGRGRKPREHVIRLGRIDAVKGSILDIPLVDAGFPKPGWDHTRKRGWGPKKDTTLIGKSNNVAILECEGAILTQKHRFFITVLEHVGRKEAPVIYVQDADEDVFDETETARLGDARFD